MAFISILLLEALSLNAPFDPNSKGWNAWHFGDTLTDVLQSQPKVTWNSYSIGQCQEEVELDGCLLTSEDVTAIPSIEGIRLSPQLRFDKRGHLSDISFIYSRDGLITRDQCLDIYSRVFDWQSSKGTSFYYNTLPQLLADTKAGWVIANGVTEAGNKFTYGMVDGSRPAYITTATRSFADPGPTDRSKPITDWGGGPYVSLFSALITIDGNRSCHVTVTFSDGKDTK